MSRLFVSRYCNF